VSDLDDDLLKRRTIIDEALNEYVPVVFPRSCTRPLDISLKLEGRGCGRWFCCWALKRCNSISLLRRYFLRPFSVELIHNFTLIHDDIMDEDATRRSIETVHTKWGMSEAVLAGDALYAKAFEVLSYTKTEPENATKCLRLLSKACLRICEGQWLDIKFENNKNISEADYLDMVQKRQLCFTQLVWHGGILGGGTDSEVNALWEFGIAMA